MLTRTVLVASLAAAIAVAGGLWSGSEVTPAAAALQPGAQPATPVVPPSDDDATIRAFLRRLEEVVLAGSAEQFAELEGPLGNQSDALSFAKAELRSGVTRAVVQERDRQELSLSGIPGGGYSLTIDAFIEHGNRARVATWQFYVRRTGDSWGIIRQQVVSSVDNLFRLTMKAESQYDATNLVIRSEDLELSLVEGTVFSIDTDQGVTGLVLMGRGEMRFAPEPETERGQIKIFTGSEVLETPFTAAFVRVGSATSHFDASALVQRPVDARDLRRAQQIFAEESPKSFAVDLADLTRDAWTLLPGQDDFLAEIRTRRFETLTYARSANEPEDIALFERTRKRNISIYPSKSKLAERGRFYTEDDAALFDVLDYEIDVTSLPEREWIEGRARMHIRVRGTSLGQLTIRLADNLVVRSIFSDTFGRLFNLRVTGQNTVLVNLPATLTRDTEMRLTIAYGGRLSPQAGDRETLALGQFGDPVPGDFRPDSSTPRPEASYLYSNRSYWYPQSTVSDYATATVRLTVPAQYGCVATGEPVGSPDVFVDEATREPRRRCVFRAAQPARYLSFLVSRFVRTSVDTVSFADIDAAAGQGGATGQDTEPRLSLTFTVESNPRQTGKARELTPRAADIIRFYRTVVGDSPYPSFTLALVENLLPGGHSPPYFALLNQPLPNSPLVWRNDPAAFENYPEFFVAHEIAHQWWGHGVGWRNYHEQWLSEGFSQYFAALYAREFRGERVFQNVLRRMRRWAIDQSGQGPVYLGYRVGHIRNDGRAFRAVVYNKGAMVLHMLRQLVGDDVFFRGLRRFYLGARFSKVGTEDFRVAMEVESGRSLARFFERWIYSAGVPEVVFSYRVEPTASGEAAVLRFEQAGPVYDFPATVTLTYANGQSVDTVVPVLEQVVEVSVPLTGPLRTASISRNDTSLAEFRTPRR